jgi:hypothetical protein
MIRWPWQREARPIEPRSTASTRALELETAEEILAEVFHARPADVEEMIRLRQEERSWREERECPATFALGSDYGPEL